MLPRLRTELGRGESELSELGKMAAPVLTPELLTHPVRVEAVAVPARLPAGPEARGVFHRGAAVEAVVARLAAPEEKAEMAES